MFSGNNIQAYPETFRKQSVRGGDLVPSPAQEVPQLMSALEQYIHASVESLPLIQAGLVYVQLETIYHEYYRMLDRVRTHGELERWIMLYLTEIRDSTRDGPMRAQ